MARRPDVPTAVDESSLMRRFVSSRRPPVLGRLARVAARWRCRSSRASHSTDTRGLELRPETGDRRPTSPSFAYSAVLLLAAFLAWPDAARGEARRVVLIKADGLPQGLVDVMVRERNPRTGRSVLPWIEHVFYEGGTRVSNFYVRGMSLSGPSWSMLDTGHHLLIKGNVEFDRYTHHPYDYLNFIPFWLGNAAGRRGDMWGTGVLDDLGVPLLLDAYGFDERYQSFQLFQRGGRWTTLSASLQKRVTSRTPRQLVDEWFVGFDTRAILLEQLERELIARLDDPRVRYLDYYTTDVDHAVHHNRDRATHRSALQELDAVVGRIWTAIRGTPQADETVLVLVSDHGVNTDERVYSQGYNLVHLLSSASGGGHHVVTKRRLMTDYSIKGVYPLVPLITTVSKESRYLKGRQNDYPTALVDFDGNERVSIHLRHVVLNTLHILLSELQRKNLAPRIRSAAADAFLGLVDRHRAAWERTSAGMRAELAALERERDRARAQLPGPDEREHGVVETDQERDSRVRLVGRLESWTRELTEYRAYLDTLDRLLRVTRADLVAARVRAQDVVAPRAMGDRNSLHDLQHYAVGVGPSGLALAADGSLDMERSFARIDYFSLLTSIRVRNNVQPGVTNAPVDFTAVRVPCGDIEGAPDPAAAETCVWLDSGADRQALLLGRMDPAQGLMLRYLPVARLAADARGRVTFTRIAWSGGLPLRLWEDERLEIPPGQVRASWLDGWHDERTWLRATHRTAYSNAVVGLHEHFATHPLPAWDDAGRPEDTRLIRRLRERQRAIVEPDVLVVAADHWNFDVRGFNPGGNHGSFLRPSTHSTLMFAGGARTGVRAGVEVEEPYDSLSFLPTVLSLTGQLDAEGQPSPELAAKGFSRLPGRPIREIAGSQR
jgi:hypothetical protein